MEWPEILIEGWEHFLRIASRSTRLSGEGGYTFRGQADAAWSLRPSICRYLAPDITPTQSLELEERLFRQFSSLAHLYLPNTSLPTDQTAAAWWPIMQHHRAPTRLLDWTGSIYVAAYFAVEQHWDADGAIWSFHPKPLSDWTTSRFGPLVGMRSDVVQKWLTDPAAGPGMFVMGAGRMSDRMAAQQGVFTINFQILADHGEVIAEALGADQSAPSAQMFTRMVVPRDLKPEFLRQLRSMNVTAGTLFPGADGLGQATTELARLASVYPRAGEGTGDLALSLVGE